jgi:hypothetical protein
MDKLQEFIQKVMEEAGLSDMPETFLDEYRERLVVEAQKRLSIVSLAALSEEERLELEKLIKETKSDAEAINSYLSSHIDDYQGLMTRSLEEFAQEVIASAKELEK